FNMSGWRVGMLCGSEEHLNTVRKVKPNMDSGMFYPLQIGAIAALKVSSTWLMTQNEIYQHRKDKILSLAHALNCTPSKEQSGLFIWARVPEGETSESLVEKLLHQHSIFVAPGFIFGSQGEGYIRFSLCATADTIEKALNRVQS